MPNPGLDSARELVKAVKEGRITEEEIDIAVLPVIEAALHVKDNDHSKKFDKGAHHKLARKAAANSAVLLKNDEDILLSDPASVQL